MRFYATGRTARVVMTTVWIAIFATWSTISWNDMERHRWSAWLWVFIASTNGMNLWVNYWTVEPGALVQHSLFWRKRYDPENLRYAGPVRRPAMRRWLRRSIELQVAGYSDVKYAAVADRLQFLHALQSVAPRAEIVEAV